MHTTIQLGVAVLACALTASGCSSEQSDLATTPTDDAGTSCQPLENDPPLGRSGYRLDGWHWQRRGVVLEVPAALELDGYIAPAALLVSGTWHLWVTSKQGLQHRIQHSVSTDGLSFSVPEPTTGLAGEDVIAYPTVWHDGSRFWLWYGSGSIDVAQSSDGMSWTMVAEGALRVGEAGSFDSLSVLYPSVVRDSSGYAMYYTGFDGQRFALGRARSADGTSWVKDPAGAVLERGGADTFDNHAVAQPAALVDGEQVLLWYGGYDTSQSDPGPYRIGLGRSTDGASFVREGLTLDLSASGAEAYSTRDPTVLRTAEGLWMAYVGMGDDRRYRILVATSDSCLRPGG